MLLRIRAQAEKAAEAYAELDDYPDLRIRMIRDARCGVAVKAAFRFDYDGT